MKRNFKKKLLVLTISIFTFVLGLFCISGCAPIDELVCAHDWGAVKTQTVKPATCISEGSDLWTCGKCGKTKTVTVPMKAHDYYQEIVTREPTCKQVGELKKTCRGCDKIVLEEIPKVDHVEIKINQVFPTCTQAGHTAYSYCQICNSFIIPKVEIPALGHSIVIDKVIAPTCTASGKTEGQHCGVCNTVLLAQKTLDPLGHDVVVDKAILATCETAGKTAGSHCKVCREVLVAQEEIAPNGHDFDSDGNCTVCGEHKHTPVTDAAVKATCTSDGLTEGTHCEDCGAVLTPQEVIKAQGHTLDDNYNCTVCGLQHAHTVITLEAVAKTCTTNGLTAGTSCADCGKVLTGQEVIPASHNRVKVDSIAPTCSSTGLSEGSKCADCGEIFLAQEIVPTAPHTYKTSSICEDCGYKLMGSTDKITFEMDTVDNGAWGKEYYHYVEDIILEGDVFLSYISDPYAILPTIGIGTSKAYYMGFRENQVDRPEMTTQENTSLRSFIVVAEDEEKGIYYGYADKVQYFRYSGLAHCTALENVVLGEGIETIGEGMFGYCTALEDVIIPASVTCIEANVFTGCSSLKKITMLSTTPPEMLASLAGCNGDLIIEVPAESVEAYKTADGWNALANRIVAIS